MECCQEEDGWHKEQGLGVAEDQPDANGCCTRQCNFLQTDASL